jgi:hypothetical protein
MATIGNITLDGNFNDWTSSDIVQTPANSVAGYNIYGAFVTDAISGSVAAVTSLPD